MLHLSVSLNPPHQLLIIEIIYIYQHIFQSQWWVAKTVAQVVVKYTCKSFAMFVQVAIVETQTRVKYNPFFCSWTDNLITVKRGQHVNWLQKESPIFWWFFNCLIWPHVRVKIVDNLFFFSLSLTCLFFFFIFFQFLFKAGRSRPASWRTWSWSSATPTSAST